MLRRKFVIEILKKAAHTSYKLSEGTNHFDNHYLFNLKLKINIFCLETKKKQLYDVKCVFASNEK